MAVVIALAGLAAYANSFRTPFVLDDAGSIVDNPTIQHLWPVSDALSPPRGTGITVEGRPILNLSLALNHAISGEAVWSYHAVNLLIHVLAGLTLFGIVRRTLALGKFSALRPGDEPLPAAVLGFAAALLWTLHPLQTESVTYTIQRAESLMGLFYLLTLYCFIRGTERSAGAWHMLAVLSCALGMATKEVMVSAPMIVLLYDRTFVSGSFREAWRRRRIFYLGLVGATSILLVLVLRTGTRGGTAGFGIGVTPWDYALTQPQAIAHYLWLSFWPRPLVFDYGADSTMGGAAVLPYAILIAALAAAAAVAVWKRRAAGFLGVWFFAILAPTSSIVPSNTQTLAEHRMYLPLAAVTVAAVLGLCALMGRRSVFVFSAAALILGALSFRRNGDYRSALILWSDTVAKCPGNPRAQSNLGDELAKFPDRRPETVAHYEEALRIKPDLAETHSNLANILVTVPGREAEALAHYYEAVRLKPTSAQTHNNLASALATIPGREPEALAHFEAALRLAPNFADAHYNLANTLTAIPGRMPKALRHYEEALRINPNDVAVLDNLASALATIPGRTSEALARYEQALRINPNNAAVQNNLAILYAQTGRLAEAIAHWELALKLDPTFTGARENLNKARAVQSP